MTAHVTLKFDVDMTDLTAEVFERCLENLQKELPLFFGNATVTSTTGVME